MLVKLVSTAGTGWFYLARRNPVRNPTKLIARKYDPRVNKHVIFEEAKLKRGGTKKYQ
jgi:large subunit ribosomal protein L33